MRRILKLAVFALFCSIIAALVPVSAQSVAPTYITSTPSFTPSKTRGYLEDHATSMANSRGSATVAMQQTRAEAMRTILAENRTATANATLLKK